MRSIITKTANGILDLLFPENVTCLLCDREADGDFCDECKAKIIYNDGVGNKRCKKCSRPLIAEEDYCPSCANNTVYFDEARAVCIYKDGAMSLVYKIKFGAKKYLSNYFAGEIARLYAESEMADVIIPVPIHKTKLKKRGYNQSALIAKRVAKITGVPYSTVLSKVVETPDQVGLSGEERRKNLHGAFRIEDKGEIKGKTVMLVDDVLTTGATLSECARILKLAGAKRIICAVFAVTETRVIDDE